MTRWLLLALLLQGCGPAFGRTCATHSPSTPPVSEATLRAAWAHDFGAMPSPACDTHWIWQVVSASTMDRYYCDSVANAGCTTYFEGCPLTVTTQAYAADSQLAAHEFAHYALKCSTGNSDPQHTNVAVWAPRGFVHSFER